MDIKGHIRHIRSLISSLGVDAFYLSGTDDYLNEYVPLEDSHRYAVSGFSGSTGDVLLTRDELRLYVDGRYHEQADAQCDPALVHIVKCTLDKSLAQALGEDIESLGLTSLGFVSTRISQHHYGQWKSLCRLVPVDSNPFEVAIPTLGEGLLPRFLLYRQKVD